jgi:hemerythrin
VPNLGWQDTWNTRIDLLDTEHRELVEMLHELTQRFTRAAGSAHQYANALDEDSAPPDGAGLSAQHDALMAALDRLGERAREHFQHEEEFMRTINYPDLGAHRSEHVLLLAEYTEMVRDLKKLSITHLDPETVGALRRWLVGHMVAADKEYADYYFSILGKQDNRPRR